MKIILPTDFLEIIKDKSLLLDTNFFIDAFLNPTEFGKFMNQLRENRIILLTLDVVRMEFLKGAPNDQKYKEKKNSLKKW